VTTQLQLVVVVLVVVVVIIIINTAVYFGTEFFISLVLYSNGLTKLSISKIIESENEAFLE